jgi:hypothetical protein
MKQYGSLNTKNIANSYNVINTMGTATSVNKTSMTKSSNVGRTYKTLYRCYKRDSTSRFGEACISAQNVVSDNLLIPSYPLSPLFNHTWDGTTIYEDVGTLATGLGYPAVTVDASPAYLDAQKNDQYIFRITKSGNVGTARYEFVRTSKPGSMNPTNNRCRIVHSLTRQLYYNNTYIGDNFLFHSSGTDESLRFIDYYRDDYLCEYKNNKHIYYNGEYRAFINSNANAGTGLLLLNVIDPASTIQLDKGSTPAFPQISTPTTNCALMARSISGDLFICHSTGLLKISDPLGTPVYTDYTLADLGLSSSPKSVDVGITGFIGCITDNKEVSVSSDNGTSWSAYTVSIMTTTTIPFIRMTNDINIALIGRYTTSNSYCRVINISTDTNLYNGFYNSNYNGVSDLVPLGNTGVNCYAFCHENGISSKYLILGNNDMSVTKDLLTPSGFAYGYYQLRTLAKDAIGNNVVAILSTERSTDNKSYFITLENLSFRTSGDSIGDTSYSSYYKPVYFYDYNENDGIDPCSAGMLNIEGSYSYRMDNKQLVFQPSGNIFNTSGKQASFVNHLKYERQIYRWNGSAWQLNYSKDTDATGDGSSSATAVRKNFDTDANRFNGGCSLDISTAFSSATYNTNGMTVLVTAANEVKNTPTFNGSDWETTVISDNKENPLSCLFEITEYGSKASIALMFAGYNNKTVLIDSTNPANPVHIDIEAQPAPTQNRYALTISSDGSTVKVYKGGSQIGATITLVNAFNMATTYTVSVGSRNRCPWVGVENFGSNYKGTIENIQVFNDVMSGANLSNDAGAPLGLVTATNLVVRYLMTMDYGEGKVTHAAAESTIGGVNIAFGDGDLSADSYSEFDNYLCHKSEGGITKDNTSSFDLTVEHNNVGKMFNTATSPTNGSTTVPAVGAVVTELANFNTNKTVYYKLGNVGAFNINSEVNRPVAATQTSTGDLIVEFTVDQIGIGSLIVRLGNPTNFASTSNTHRTNMSTIKLGSTSTNGDVELYDETGTLQTLTGVAPIGTKIKVEWIRANDTTKVYKWDGTAWVQLGADLALSAANVGSYIIFGGLETSDTLVALADVKVTYTTDPNIFYIGDKATSTGVYDPNFAMGSKEGVTVDSLVVMLDGTPITENSRIISSTYNYTANGIPANNSEPPAGTYNIYPLSGILQFNSSDAGKVVSIANAYLEILI